MGRLVDVHNGKSGKRGFRACFSLRAGLCSKRCCVNILLICVLLYALYVVFEIRLLEKLISSKSSDDMSRYHFSSSLRPPSLPALPECVRPPRGAAWLLDTPGCRIPDHDAFSDEVKGMIKDFPSVVCADPPPLVVSNDTHIMVRTELAHKYNASKASCCYTAMWRFEGPDWQNSEGVLTDGVIYGNDIRFGKECVPFEAPTAVPHEFVRVTCKSAGKDVYKDFHGFVPLQRPRGHPGAVAAREFVSENALNVLIVGIDSVSRLNFIRKMPRTRAFLEDRLGGKAMLGYNKVEDNTFPNLVPLLSGMNVHPDLRASCWPADTAHFDACPWVWKRFNREGYVNMFAEDTAWMGLFHYIKRGFVNQPTDYDPRPIMYLGEKQVGRGGGFNAKYCIGQRHQIEVMFDYSRKFLRAMALQRRKFFSLAWGTSLSHDMLNQPDEADAMYEKFLNDVLDMGVFNNTALIVMSDHGLRFGAILNTYQGHLENMLPFTYVVVPDWVRHKYPKAMHNLECNRRSLVTTFDLHETLHNFMDLSTLQDDKLAADEARVRAAFNSTGKDKPPRGISLFTPIPGARTCDAAGIPPNYCSCQHLTVTDPKSEEVRRAAEFVVAEVNNMLGSHPECHRLQLDEVVRAQRGSPLRTKDLKAGAVVNEYQTTLRMQPGGALLSATVRQHVQTGSTKLAGTISRLNAYGHTSWCVNSTALKPVCLCKQTFASTTSPPALLTTPPAG